MGLRIATGCMFCAIVFLVAVILGILIGRSIPGLA